MAAEMVIARRELPRLASIGTFARQTTIVAVATALYFLVRGFIANRTSHAFAHADDIVDFERSVGLFHEPALQRWALDSGWVGTVVNKIYIFGHWPVIVATLVWLLMRHRHELVVYRNAMLVSGAIGLVIFTLYPVAPPRFLHELGFVDTVTLHTHAYRVLQPPQFTNEYAAMPSLHVGWNLLMGVALIRHARLFLLRAFGVVMPVLMYAATVLTANHLLIDGIVGSAIALLGLYLATGGARAAVRRVTRVTASPAVRLGTAPRRPLPHGDGPIVAR